MKLKVVFVAAFLMGAAVLFGKVATPSGGHSGIWYWMSGVVRPKGNEPGGDGGSPGAGAGGGDYGRHYGTDALPNTGSGGGGGTWDAGGQGGSGVVVVRIRR